MMCAVSLGVGAQETVFNVDMTCAPEFDNVFVTGPWCGWCAENGYNVMTDDDGDGVYTVIIEDLEGTVEYKYAVDGFTGQENLVNDMIDGATCAPFTDFNVYANRQTTQGTINNDSYGTCDGVCNDQPPTYVTFRIDMSGYEGSLNPANVTWNSGANGWCGNCAPMEAIGGDVYELTVPLTGDTVEYKFAIGSWDDQEDLEPESSCAKTTYDEGAPNGCCYVNRFVALGCEGTIEMPLVCWNSCASCQFEPILGCTDVAACNYLVDSTEDDGSCEYDTCDGLLTIAQVIAASADHTILAEMLEVTGYSAVLSGTGPWTLFALADYVFNDWLYVLNLENQTNYDLADLLAMNGLGQVLEHHIFAGSLLNADFVAGTEMMVSGQSIDVHIDEYGISLNDTVIITSTYAESVNGIIHFIDGGPLIPAQIYGCSDINAANYSILVNVDDGSCIYGENCNAIEVFGCTDSTACNYAAWANTDSGLCEFPGDDCDDLDDMTVDDIVNEFCLCEGQEFVDEGCTVPIACNYNPYAINDDNSCVFVCPGCTDPVACNFDAGALQEDGTCSYPEDSGWCNCEGAVSDALGICGGTCGFDQDSDGVCDDVDDCIGIVDACGICNGPGAIYPCGCDDYPEGSCSCDGLTLVDQCGVCDGDGTSCIGCMYDFACTYDSEATIQDVSMCEFGTCGGCLDPLACNYNPTVNGDDGTCEYPAVYLDCGGNCLNDVNGNGVCDENETFGCAYPSACNFDPQVTANDGSCDYSCVESLCEPDYDFGNASWGFSPNRDIGESFAEGTVNLPYSDAIHALFPLDAAEILPEYGLPSETFIDSVFLLQEVQANGLLTDVLFTDVETDENFFSEDLGFVLTLNNPSDADSLQTVIPGEQFCMSVFGVPVREGSYRVRIPFEIWAYIDWYGLFQFQYVFEAPLSVVVATIGCTDPDACNYQPTAVEDDGSCGVFDECGVCLGPGILEGECDCDGNVTDAIGVCGGDCLSDFNANSICDSDEVLGCTYGSAENYNPQATSDDGTCVGFEGADSGTCLFDGDGDGFVGSGDLLGLLSEFGIGCD